MGRFLPVATLLSDRLVIGGSGHWDASSKSHNHDFANVSFRPEAAIRQTAPTVRRVHDAEAVLSNPSAFKAEEIRTLRDQNTSNLERAWETIGRSEDELTGVMMQISQVVAKQLSDKK